jgi:hypothetical protein
VGHAGRVWLEAALREEGLGKPSPDWGGGRQPPRNRSGVVTGREVKSDGGLRNSGLLLYVDRGVEI